MAEPVQRRQQIGQQQHRQQHQQQISGDAQDSRFLVPRGFRNSMTLDLIRGWLPVLRSDAQVVVGEHVPDATGFRLAEKCTAPQASADERAGIARYLHDIPVFSSSFKAPSGEPPELTKPVP